MPGTRGQSAPFAGGTDDNGRLMTLLAVFPLVKAHPSWSFPSRGDRYPSQVGTGGARSRAIRAKIRRNICRDTATSAIWNVT